METRMRKKSEYRKNCEEYKPIALKRAKEDILKNPQILDNMLEDEDVYASYRANKYIQNQPKEANARKTSTFCSYDVSSKFVYIKNKIMYFLTKGEHKFTSVPNQNRDRWGEVYGKFFNPDGSLKPYRDRPDHLILETFFEMSIIPAHLIIRYFKEGKIKFLGNALVRPHNLDHGCVTEENKFFSRLFHRYRVKYF